ncbi:MAG: hypothetical protein M1830_008596 [Pleopsidium flavum]|nr:MAG: hypothetical protein M1830_008596 [Pleopsidium flavum]
MKYLNKSIFGTATAVILCSPYASGSPMPGDSVVSRMNDIIPPFLKRQGPAFAIAPLLEGFISIITDALPVGVAGGEFGGAVSQAMFGKMNAEKPWGHCSVETTPGPKANAGSATTKHEDDWQVCWWDDKTMTSGVQYFNDPGIGDYSIEWTCHDDKAGAHGTSGCLVQGIGNPIVKFYRKGYTLVEYMYNGTWEGGSRGNGKMPLCNGGVTNQGHKGGASMGWS